MNVFYMTSNLTIVILCRYISFFIIILLWCENGICWLNTEVNGIQVPQIGITRSSCRDKISQMINHSVMNLPTSADFSLSPSLPLCNRSLGFSILETNQTKSKFSNSRRAYLSHITILLRWEDYYYVYLVCTLVNYIYYI